MTDASFLKIAGLSHSYGEQQVLSDITFAVEPGEIIALLGPSGSGKTTLLRAIAGFEQPKSGSIEVEGRDVTALPPAKRGFGMVFQSYALFPHLDVRHNVSFGLEAQGVPKEEIEPRVREMLDLVELGGFEERRVSEISGGQQQRVALARALAPRPSLLMLDEPLSNLDPALRDRTRRELRQALKSIGITTVLVTHEQEEAFDLGDRVAVLHEGRLDQIGSARELYSEPSTAFVANFVGRSSSLPGVWSAASADAPVGAVEVEVGGQKVVWRCLAPEQRNGKFDGREVVDLVLRPEALALVSDATDESLTGQVLDVRYLGAVQWVRIDLGGREVEVQLEGALEPPAGTVRVAPRFGDGADEHLLPRAFLHRSAEGRSVQ